MAYVAPTIRSAGDAVTAADYNIMANNAIFLAKPPACRLYNTANLTGYTMNSTITWSAEQYDTDNMHSNVTNTGRITATTAGMYLVSGCVYATFGGSPASGEIYCAVSQDLNNYVAFNMVDFGTQPNVSVISGAGIVYLGVNDWITLVYNGAGTSPIIQSQRSYLAATWIGNTA